MAPRVSSDGGAFVQQVDEDTNQALFDVFLSLEGLGLPTGTGNNQVNFFGVELQGIENLELRLSSGDDELTVSVDEYRGVDTVGRVLARGTAPETAVGLDGVVGDLRGTFDAEQALPLTIVAGAGNDIINLEQIRGETVILGGAGSDVLNIGDPEILDGIDGRVIFDGAAHIEEIPRQLTADDFNQVLLQNLPEVFVDTEPANAFIDAARKVTVFAAPKLLNIIRGEDSGDLRANNTADLTNDLFKVEGPLQVRAVVLYEDNVQEFGVHESGLQQIDTTTGFGLFVDDDGSDTTEPVGNDGNPRRPLIERVQAGTVRVLTNTDPEALATIAQPLSNDDEGRRSIAAQPVYIDSTGIKTFGLLVHRHLII